MGIDKKKIIKINTDEKEITQAIQIGSEKAP